MISGESILGYPPSRVIMSSILEQYRIADFLDWNREKRLQLNPDFQRGSVWTPQARTFLIDTILRKLPIRKVYLRTRIDVSTQKTIREIVDGQQRLRAIIEFSENKFILSKRASEFAGKFYSDLTEEEQETFLSYPIAVDQLVNASVDDVLEVFARLNSYTVTLNPPEKRHAKYQGDFKWAIRNASRTWAMLWEKYKVLTVRERVRMMDDSLTAEMVGILLDGVKDGGQPKIDMLYRRHNERFDVAVLESLNAVLNYFVKHLADTLVETPLLRPPHLLMLFAAIASILVGIPQGDLSPEEYAHPAVIGANLNRVKDNLLLLGSIIDLEAPEPDQYVDFWRTSRASTQRISSRRVRFPFYVRALTAADDL